MVDLNPIWHNVAFVRQLASLRAAYVRSHDVFTAEQAQTSQRLGDHIERLMAGADNDDADDGEGNYVSRRMLLDIENRAVIAADVALRKSFVTAVYHLWERSVQRWSIFGGKGNPNHADLVELARNAGVTGDLSALKPIHNINNALKHDNEKWLKLLDEKDYKKYVFYPYDLKHGPKPSPYEMVSLKHQDLVDLFDLMATLGPDISQPWPNMRDAFVDWELAEA
ncbi:hypothetical protein [Sphingomonas aerolata]|uniref:hypothetical protein n=1 Tax=Sphingomonas aerolata TaxID=185951 RepID=UPI002FE336E1